MQLQGIVPPLITPLAREDQLDHGALERLLERVIQGGVAGVFVLGTTGEGTVLPYDVRRDLIQATLKLVHDRVPVLVGATDCSFVETQRTARFSADHGAAAMVVAPPFYYPVEQADLIRYFRKVATDSPLPVFLYNMPACCGTAIEFDTVKALCQSKNICGIKDSCGEFENFTQLLKLRSERPDWRFFIGPEQLTLASVVAGGDGGVNGGSNLMPELFVKLEAAARKGDTSAAEKLQAQVLQLGKIYRTSEGFMGVLRGLKCAMALVGYCTETLSQPFPPIDEELRTKVRPILKELGFA